MTEEQIKVTFCPNCRQYARRSGNEIICETCDATFVITKKQGAKLKEVGAIDDLKHRVERLESLLPGEEPTPENDQAEPIEEETEEPIL